MVGLADKLLQDLATMGGGGPEIADGLYSACLPRTALMNPIGKGGGLPRLLSTVYLFCGVLNYK
jgi:hypothetical protein